MAPSNGKYPSVAIEYQLKGNQYFFEGDLWNAFYFYDQALSKAVPRSEAIGIIYACRSVVILEIMHNILDKIQLELGHIPNDLLLKVKKSEEISLRWMSKMTSS
ncbi:unnamed protein product [Diamesa tonsa]